ncbi:MAG: histidinol phosphate phosphatase domain-containing protein [Thermoplasmata archaeon]
MSPSRRGAGGAGGRRRFDFHAHTYLTDGRASATDRWTSGRGMAHRALAVTDHVALEDPRPLIDRLRAERKAFEGGPMVTPVGVELTMVPPRRIADAVRAARRAGAEIVVVHGETRAPPPVPPGTNHAAVECGDVDVLAHPGFLTERDAELARAHGTAIELSGRGFHGLTNGHVARVALAVGADLVVDSDAHDPTQLLPYARARDVARGAGLSATAVLAAREVAPARLIKRGSPR